MSSENIREMFFSWKKKENEDKLSIFHWIVAMKLSFIDASL